jgi:hypothetical protein
VGPWRGVNTNQNGVYLECFMDECAKAAGKDPLEFRRALMKDHPKHLGVLNAAAEKAGWGTPLPPGRHRGIAQFMGYGSYSAAVAEVSMDAGKVKVHRMVLALNCGHAVNPDQIAAQVEGSVAYGLTAALYGELNVDKGRIIETNFHNYRIMHLAQMPKVETVIVPTYDFWGGVGEPTIVQESDSYDATEATSASTRGSSDMLRLPDINGSRARRGVTARSRVPGVPGIVHAQPEGKARAHVLRERPADRRLRDSRDRSRRRRSSQSDLRAHHHPHRRDRRGGDQLKKSV